MEWVSLLIIVAFSGLSFYQGTKIILYKKGDLRQSVYHSLIGLGLIYLLTPQAFWFAPLEIWIPSNWLFERKIDWLSIIIIVCSSQLVVSFTKLVYTHEELRNDSEIMGFPVVLLPQNKRGTFGFSALIIIAVIVEELIYRLVMFYLFFNLLGLTGWPLIFLTSLIFSLGHSYQGLKGIIGSLILGILLGIAYLITGSILAPIILHLLHNSAIIVYAVRRNMKPKSDSMSY
jgi:membrane protease YdiL (CAAX protease family)